LCDLLRDCLWIAKEAVEAEAKAREASASDLATTLLLSVATAEFVAAGQIGDGAVVARLGSDDIRAVTSPWVGQYVNETIFITSTHAFDEVQLHIERGDVTAMAMFTDGLQLLTMAMPSGQPHAPFFRPLMLYAAGVPDLLQGSRRLAQFLDSPAINERTDDDKTLLLAALCSL
jgi:hypothetical protein